MAEFALYPIIEGNGDNLINRLGSLVSFRLDTVFSTEFVWLSYAVTNPTRTASVSGTGLTGDFTGTEPVLSGGIVTGIDLTVDTTTLSYLVMSGLNADAARLGGFMIADQSTALANYLLRGNDVIHGHVGDDTLQGLRGNDRIYGEQGDDTLSGGRGADSLHGWVGQDSLTGGAGRDAFVFDIAPGADNADAITDFASGIDRIEIDDAVFRRAPAEGDLRAARFVEGTAATTTAHRVVYDSATGDLSWDQDGVGGRDAVVFARLGAGTTLLFSDISII